MPQLLAGLQQSEGLLNIPFQSLGLSRGKVTRLSLLNQKGLLRGAGASAQGDKTQSEHPVLGLRGEGGTSVKC